VGYLEARFYLIHGKITEAVSLTPHFAASNLQQATAKNCGCENKLDGL
jgi:hypothetical protein